jgi:hypothetical protein
MCAVQHRIEQCTIYSLKYQALLNSGANSRSCSHSLTFLVTAHEDPMGDRGFALFIYDIKVNKQIYF